MKHFCHICQNLANCLICLTLWRLVAFGDFRKKHRNARGFVREFLWSGKCYRPSQSVKRCGKSSSLYSKNFFWLGGADFLSVTS